ncbi:hypothetical protein D3C76_1023140 [compost metagenome]
MATQFKEVIVQADLLQAQHVLPDGRDLLLQIGLGCQVAMLQLAGIGLGQGLAVELAVGAQGHLFEEQQVGRDHVVRQGLTQLALDGFAQQRLFIRAGVGDVLFASHHIGHQLQAVAAWLSQHQCVAHDVLGQQARFDFAQFDAETANLHLMVDAPDVLDHPVGVVARQVAAAVQAPAGAAERVRQETLGGQARAVEVTAGQQLAADHQFADHANRRRGSAVVQQVDAAPGQHGADGQGRRSWLGAADVVAAIEGGHGDRGFGRAVGVEQAHMAQARLLPGSQAFRRHGFAAGMHLFEYAIVARA